MYTKITGLEHMPRPGFFTRFESLPRYISDAIFKVVVLALVSKDHSHGLGNLSYSTDRYYQRRLNYVL